MNAFYWLLDYFEHFMLVGWCCTLSQIPPVNILFEIDIKQGDITVDGFFHSSEGRVASLILPSKVLNKCVNLFVEYDRKLYDLCQALDVIL